MGLSVATVIVTAVAHSQRPQVFLNCYVENYRHFRLIIFRHPSFVKYTVTVDVTANPEGLTPLTPKPTIIEFRFLVPS